MIVIPKPRWFNPWIILRQYLLAPSGKRGTGIINRIFLIFFMIR